MQIFLRLLLLTAISPLIARADGTISGHIHHNFEPLAGVTVSSSGGQVAVTDASGYFLLNNVPNSGSFKITPQLAGYTFIPAAVDAAANDALSFITASTQFQISGSTENAAGAPISAVTITASYLGSTVSSSSGSFGPLGPLYLGDPLAVTAIKAGYNFEPQQPIPPVIAGDVTVRFVGSADSDCPADLNRDGIVSNYDLQQVLECWGIPGCTGGDANGDGNIDNYDLQAIFNAWGRSCS